MVFENAMRKKSHMLNKKDRDASDNWGRLLPGIPRAWYIWNPDIQSVKEMVGYEIFLEKFESWGIPRLPGDFIEIGCFVGGGTAKLAGTALPLGKKVFAVDIFEPASDDTKNMSGFSMSDIYHLILQGRSQEELFYENTSGFDNIVLLKMDSRNLGFAPDQKFSFAFIDGNHDPAVVKSDFALLWPHIVPGGVIGFHDYQGDLPQTTCAINELLKKYLPDINKIEQIPKQWLLFAFKKGNV